MAAMASIRRSRLHFLVSLLLGLFATEQLFVVPRRAALSLLGTLQVTMPAMADEIDDEVAEYIKQMRSLILVQPGERAKPWRKDYKEPGPTDYNYNLQFQREQSEFVRLKYEKMKERVVNARNENERAKALRVMKAEALKEAVSITEADLLK